MITLTEEIQKYRVILVEQRSVDSPNRVVERQEAILLVQLLLLVDRHLNQENITRLDVLSKGIDRNHLAPADGHTPIPRDFLDLLLAAGTPAKNECPHSDHRCGLDQVNRTVLDAHSDNG